MADLLSQARPSKSLCLGRKIWKKMIEPIFLGKRQSPIHKIAACLRMKDYSGQDKFSCLLPDFQIEFNL